MAGTDINDNLLTAGQNQGIERAVLPMPQLDIAFNVRLRKGSRWGKRYGHTALSVATLGTAQLGGSPRAIGSAGNSAFALVDDQCSNFDSVTNAFFDRSLSILGLPIGSIGADPTVRVAGAASGWLPNNSFFPVPAKSLQGQNTTPCSSCYALGYLWTAVQFVQQTGLGDQMIRVVATDPADQTLVFMQDFAPALNGFGGITYPKLIVAGNQVVLTYLYTSGAATTAIMGRLLTSLAGRFGAETAIVPAASITSYDASSYSSTQFLVTYTRTAANLIVDLVTVATWAIAATRTIGEIATECTVLGNTNGIYVGYGAPATTSTKVAVFPAGLGAAIGTGVLTATVSSKPLLSYRSTVLGIGGGGVRAVFGASYTGNPKFGSFFVRDVDATGTAQIITVTSFGAYPISLPFQAGTEVYIWTETATSGPAYATLLRLPLPNSFSSNSNISLPIEMSVQDYAVSDGLLTTGADLRGVPTVAQLGTSAVFACTVPTYFAIPGSVTIGHEFRTLQATHYSDAAQSRSLVPIYADSSSFIPMGALTRVDDRGCVEQGYIAAPQFGTGTPAGGGAMTASSDYYYTAVYVSRTSLGRVEISAPATPRKVTMGAGQTQVTIAVSGLPLSARTSCQLEIYRTLSNGQTYYLASVIDGGQGIYTIVDQASDASIQGNKALYVQVGQTLANSFPPPARFGCVGGQRLFLGGLMRPDVIQASKLIFGDQSPSFADNDAFRIVLPAPCTGLAWLDVLVMFTDEGIYIASGDGPADDGNGDFGNVTRMPYELGCIEPRSVKVIDDGCFFQTSRGLYLLPRGFGSPVPAGDNVMTSLQAFPIITGVTTITKQQEQSVLWTCSNTSGTQGIRIVYDMAHKSWGVDNYVDSAGNGTAPCGIGQWIGGEIAQFGATTGANGLQASNGVYSDANNTPIQMELRTGDMRPFGVLSQGVISKVDLLAEVRSGCLLSITKTTEFGSYTSQRFFTLAAGDAQIGDLTVVETSLGNAELRDALSVRVQYDETSTSEGLALIAMTLEHEQGEGLKRVSPLSRNT